MTSKVKQVKKKTPKPTQKVYEWIVYPDAFLASALHLCNQIPGGMHDDVAITSEFFKKCGFRSGHGNYFAIYPIVFNLKHAIELYLKGFSSMDHKMYQEVHDFQVLFDYAVDTAHEPNKTILTNLRSETRPILEKYYFGTYSSQVQMKSNPDLNNEAERYPEVKISYDVSDAYEWVTHGLVEQIRRDIKFLEGKFSQAKRDLK